MSDGFEAWIEAQLERSVAGMLQSVSTDVVKERPGFGQVMRAERGSVVASPVPASYDPDPDYFFHWYRDAAAVMEALRAAHRHGAIGQGALDRLRDFVQFTRSLDRLRGRDLVERPAWRARVAPDFEQFLRPDGELALIAGERMRMETRVNPDGTIDISRWPRPQHDGSAMTALTLMRWLDTVPEIDATVRADAEQLLQQELTFTLRHSGEACFDIWEEEEAPHYYTLRIQAAALALGAHRLAGAAADECRAAAGKLMTRLDGFWQPDEGFMRSRISPAGRSARDLDIAVILAANHSEEAGSAHGSRDPRIMATLERLADTFSASFAINRGRRAPALGRYPGDEYFGGNPWYVASLAAAELHYRSAEGEDEPSRRRAGVERGDAFLETVRAFTPSSGDLSEQFDRETGEPLSAKHLAWSYAAFITACCARTRSR